MSNTREPDRPRLAVRFWWLYVLLALGNYGLAAYRAVHRDPGWGLHVGTWTVLGTCMLGLGLLFRYQGRAGQGGGRPD